MYVPYLVGNKHELQAVEKLAPNILVAAAANKHVVPLIEPVKLTGSLRTILPRIGTTGIPFFLVMNPQRGEVVGREPEVNAATFGAHGTHLGSAIPTYIVTATSSVADVTAFAARFPTHQIAFVIADWNGNAPAIGAAIQAMANVRTVLYKDNGTNIAVKNAITPTSGVLMHDGFQRRQRNADYPPISFHSDTHATYSARGYTGFGDYVMVGDTYSATGGPAAAVALHLTELDRSANALMVRHFVSQQTTGAGVDVGGKFLEAVDLLAAHVAGPPRRFLYSRACDEFIGLSQTRHFPQLGIPKELSMRHHVDLIINEIL